MNYRILILLLFFSLVAFAQNYTQKYNSIKNRTEFFDSNGQMIGYKFWNSLKGQWEVYDVANNNRTEDLYGSYTPSIDLELVNKVLNSKQTKYDLNLNRVYGHLELIKSNIYNRFSDSQKRNMALERFSIMEKSINDNPQDYSKNIVTNQMISLINTNYYEIIELVESEFQQSNSYSVESLNVQTSQQVVNEETILSGRFRANLIQEYELDNNLKTYVLVNQLNVISELFIDNEGYRFKRGNSDWLGSRLKYTGWDDSTNSHLFSDDYNQKIAIKSNFSSITWYINKVGEDYEKIIIYNNMTRIN
tara:strand:- start:18159 stop:19073 length:915 start_codon:yes stop_codon:yes gene_type:complete